MAEMLWDFDRFSSTTTTTTMSGTYHFYHKTWAFACTGFSIQPSEI